MTDPMLCGTCEQALDENGKCVNILCPDSPDYVPEDIDFDEEDDEDELDDDDEDSDTEGV